MATYPRHHLELLPVRDVLALGDGRLQLLQHPRLQRLKKVSYSKVSRSTYRSAGDGQLDLAAVRAHQLGKLVAHALEGAQPVVLGQRVEEVLDDIAAAGGVLLQLSDDGLLVVDRQRGRRQDTRQLGVPLDHLAEGVEGARGRVEGGRLRGGRVLRRRLAGISRAPWACCEGVVGRMAVSQPLN